MPHEYRLGILFMSMILCKGFEGYLQSSVNEGHIEYI